MNPDLNDRAQQQHQQQELKQQFQTEDPNDSGAEESDNEKPARRSGRRKIKIEYIEDKNRRHITFSKRKAGIMKKAYELSTLTGTQVLLLVVSETGLVYTFTTVKLQPIVTKPEGKNLIQACLNAPDPMAEQSSGDASYGNASPQIEDKKSVYDEKPEPPAITQQASNPQPQPSHAPQPPAPGSYGGNGSNNGYQPQPPYSQPPPNNAGYAGYPSYMNSQGAGYPPQQPPSQQPGYGQMPQPNFYSQQQQQQQQPAPQGYWQQQPGNPALQRPGQSPIIDDKTRSLPKK